MAEFLVIKTARAKIPERSDFVELEAGRVVDDDEFDPVLLSSQGVAVVAYVPATMDSVVKAFTSQAGRPNGEGDLVALLLAAGAIGGSGTDEHVKVTTNDTTEDFLSAKAAVGTGLTLTVLNPAANEQLEWSIDATSLAPLLDHGLLAGLPDDDHINNWYMPGRAGGQGQVIHGGTAAGDLAVLQGSSFSLVGAGDVGRISINSPVEYFYSNENTTPAEDYLIRWRPQFTTNGPYVGGYLRADYDVTYDNGFYIPGIFVDGGVSRAAASPVFAAYTFINMLHRITNQSFGGGGLNFDLVSAIAFNLGLIHERATSGTSIVTSSIGMSYAVQSRALVSGAVLTRTTQTGLAMSPTFSTVSGSTVNLGTIIAVQCNIPAVALFQPAAGIENMAGYIGLDWANMAAFGGNVLKVALRCAQAAASNAYCIQHTGTAQSQFGGQIRIPVDLTGVTFGASDDFNIGWAAANFFFFNFVQPGFGDQLRYSNPSADRYLFDSSGGNTVAEYNFNCLKASFGAQTGATGNQKFPFVSGAETITIGGDYSGMLWTFAANDVIDAALGVYATSTWNAGTPTIGTGSLVTNAIINVGGNPGSASTNRVGVRIISNPSGGSGVNAALWVTAGLAQFDSDVRLCGATTDLLGFYGSAGAAQAAAYTVTNPVVRRTFDTTTVTLQQLAEVVGTIIGDDQATNLRG